MKCKLYTMFAVVYAMVFFVIPDTAMGQFNPAHIEGGGRAVGKVLQRGDRDQGKIDPQAEILYDTLWIVDEDVADAGNGNAISGMSVFGVIYDLQLCDDYEISSGPYEITRMIVDYMNFNGGGYVPGTDVLVEVFDDLGGVPAELPTHQVTNTWSSVEVINISWWGPGTRIIVDLDSGSVVNNTGMWWSAVTPVDLTATGDWYYEVRQYGAPIYSDTHGRDGGSAHGTLYDGPYDGGYGITSWTSMADLGYTAGNSSRRIEGQPEGVSQFTISSSGVCPGIMTFSTKNAGPFSRVAFVYGFQEGHTSPIPGCEGLWIDINKAKLAGLTHADSNGQAQLVGNVPAGACSRVLVQAIDLDQCQTTNIALGESEEEGATCDNCHNFKGTFYECHHWASSANGYECGKGTSKDLCIENVVDTDTCDRHTNRKDDPNCDTKEDPNEKAPILYQTIRQSDCGNKNLKVKWVTYKIFWYGCNTDCNSIKILKACEIDACDGAKVRGPFPRGHRKQCGC